MRDEHTPHSENDLARLSELLDDELPEWEARQRIKATLDDPQAWARLSEQQAALHGLPTTDLLPGIRQRLAQDEEESLQRKQMQRSRWAGFVQGALAAGVVAALAIGIWPGPVSPPDAGPVSASAITEPGETHAQVQGYWAEHARYATYGSGNRWEEIERSESAL